MELHAYALTSDAEQGKRRLVEELHRVYPETNAAAIVDERHELRADCPLFAPGTDFTRVDFPVALMERAATSGLLAANALLARWRIRGHPLWTVPTKGRLAPLRAVAARFG